MIQSSFTCTGSYAILILYGIKRTENRSAWPEPREGRAAISCSKSFCKEEYGQFIAWASVNLPPEDFEKLPAWREVKDWPGKVVGVCDYAARARGTRAPTRLRLAEDGSPHHASPQPTNQPTNQSTNKPTNHILGRGLSVLVGLVECREFARSDSLPW